ncbi:MAG: MoaD/ThiS family protein [Novosphingobium sp.]|nr:MoaD/ThiS family protein [Novosphingobium sp.]MCP5404470.1 MoaD/ThiS family protein [Novosphingobium sp.]
MLKLVFLGRLEDAAGAAEREIEAAETYDDVLAGLEPELAATLRDVRIRLALDGVLVGDPASLSLRDGQELAFLPPVSGG